MLHFINPEDLPDEIKESIKSHIDRRDMTNDVRTHEFKQLLDSLDEDGLKSLRNLIWICSEGTASSYFQGQITALLDVKFSVCPCGSNHSSPESLIRDSDNLEASDPEEKDRDSLLEEFELEEVPIPGRTDGKMYLQCKNCKTPVVSLDDRMLRPPGTRGCQVCQQKAKWG